MRKFWTAIIFLGNILCIASCDCIQYARGTIVDKTTGVAISGVRVTNQHHDDIFDVTDSSGTFELSAISGGLRCPPMQITIEKTGYSQKKTRSSGRIELEPIPKD